MIHDTLQFLVVTSGCIKTALGVIAPYAMSIMIGQMFADNILAIWGGKHEQNR